MNIALCWATMLYHGKSSYEQKARAVVDTTRKIRDGYVSKFSKISKFSKVSKIFKKNFKIHIFFFKKLFFLRIKNIPELKLQGASDICIVSFTSDKIDIHRFQDMMNRREWQLSALQFPSG